MSRKLLGLLLAWAVAFLALGSWGNAWCEVLKHAVSEGPLTLKEIIRQNLPATVTIEVREGDQLKGSGSGFVLDRSGMIATCYHVIEELKQGSVRMHDGQLLPIRSVLAVDVANDLAILKVEGSSLVSVKLNPKRVNELGDEVVAIGSPSGLQGSISTGIVSSIRPRENAFWDLQYTAPTSLGSSGGALFNRYGEVIAVTKSLIASTGAQNLNFATPVEFLTVLQTKAQKQTLSFASLEASLEQAVKDYLEREPQNSRAQTYMAHRLLQRGEHKAALQLIGPVDATSEPEKVLVHAMAYFLQNETRSAITHFEMLSLSSVMKKKPKLYLYLAGLYLEQYRLTEAKSALERYNLLSDEKEALYYYSVGELALKYGLSEGDPRAQKAYFAKAIGFYEASEKVNPSFSIALYRKGLVQIVANDIRDAYATFKLLKTQDEKLARQLEASIQKYVEGHRRARSDYYKEVARQELVNSLYLFIDSIPILFY